MNLDITPEEYELLKKLVQGEVGGHQDESHRYKNIGNYDHYPYQGAMDTAISLAKKLGVDLEKRLFDGR